MVLGDAVSLDRIGRRICGDMHRHLLNVKLCRGLPPGVAHNDHTIGIDHNRLAGSEFVDTFDWIDRGVVGTGFIFLGLDLVKRPHFDLHAENTSKASRERKGERSVVGLLVG